MYIPPSKVRVVLVNAMNNRLKCSFCKCKMRRGQEMVFYRFTNMCNLCIKRFASQLDKKNIKEAEAVRVADKL